LFCAVCGDSSPTEIAGGHQPAAGPMPDLEARKAEVQAALGAGYEVKGLVGRGGFGEVWSVLDVQLGRDIAVKILHASLASNADYRERFRREARAIARIRHPGIVSIYHVGESNGLVFFTMPLVRGITLKAALMSPAGVTADEAQRILLEAAEALREAHAQGIIHRDLKPENIMLEGEQRRVLIMDFGVAKMDEAGVEGLTETDTVVGSPEYMSPEQATGRVLDARSDLYSLGVVAYRLLAGRLPFRAATPREVLAHHVLSPPDPFDARMHLAPFLADAVMRCLAKNPADRWQSADDLLRALTGMTPPRSASVAEATRISGTLAERTKAHAVRRRIVWVLAGLVVVLVAAAPFPFSRWRQQRQYLTAAGYASAMYRQAADSLATLGVRFVSGEITGPRYLAERDELLWTTASHVDETYGSAIDDTARWNDSARLLLNTSATMMQIASRDGGPLTLRPNEVQGCVLRTSGDITVTRDEAPSDNCWWQASGARPLAPPLEYFARFRLAARPRPDAGAGLAWCRTDGECRVAFLWPGAGLVWGSHRPRRGLVVLQSSTRGALTAGEHELRLRYQEGTLRVWLDGGLILERRSAAESAWLERPGSIHFVVQNTAVELPGEEAIGMVGRPASR
jgi:predicted Ser/Thr protein kinase